MSDTLGRIAEKLKPTFEPCDESEVFALEKAVGAQLPASHVAFLRKFGRCTFTGEALVKHPSLSPFTVSKMFGCKGNSGNILEDRQLHPEYVSRGFLPIADDDFNNRFVIDLKTGEIWFIDYSHASGSITKVAGSFDEFLERLEVEPWG